MIFFIHTPICFIYDLEVVIQCHSMLYIPSDRVMPGLSTFSISVLFETDRCQVEKYADIYTSRVLGAKSGSHKGYEGCVIAQHHQAMHVIICMSTVYTLSFKSSCLTGGQNIFWTCRCYVKKNHQSDGEYHFYVLLTCKSSRRDSQKSWGQTSWPARPSLFSAHHCSGNLGCASLSWLRWRPWWLPLSKHEEPKTFVVRRWRTYKIRHP